MKSFRVSKEEMLSHDNIEKAFLKPSRGKRDRPDIKRVLDDLENEIRFVSTMLEKGDFHPRKHEPVTINEHNYLKTRLIIKPDYKYEQVVHHIVVQAMRPGIERGMYQYVLGSIPGRGSHMGKRQIERWLQHDRVNTKYVLQIDIHHFFQSVDHDILKAWLAKKFRDRFLLDLLFIIIDAVDEGVPLGYYTSQWFSNFLLQSLDHYIKETLRVKYMTRYMDDIVCFGRNKKELHRVRRMISEFLEAELNMSLKDNYQVFRFEYTVRELSVMCPTLTELKALDTALTEKNVRHRIKTHKGKQKIFIREQTLRAKEKTIEPLLRKYRGDRKYETMVYGRPLDYMGFEFHRNKTVMRKSIMLRLNRKARQVSRQDQINPRDAAALLSSMGWVKHTDTYNMYLDRIKPIVKIKTLKKIVSKEQRRRNNVIKLESCRGDASSGAA